MTALTEKAIKDVRNKAKSLDRLLNRYFAAIEAKCLMNPWEDMRAANPYAAGITIHERECAINEG
jgi:hypothetical protein